MKETKPLAAIVFLIGAAGAGLAQPLKVADVIRPTRETLNERVQVIGYFHQSNGEDPDNLSAGPAEYKGAWVQMTMSKSLLDGPEGNRFEKHRELSERFDRKKVAVTGILRVGPIGMMQRSEVYLEAEKIDEIESPAEMNETSMPPATEQWYTRAPALERWDDLLEEQSKEIQSQDRPGSKELGIGVLSEIQSIRFHRRVIDSLAKNRMSMKDWAVKEIRDNYLAAIENLAKLREAVIQSHEHLVEYHGSDYRKEVSLPLSSALRDLDAIEADLRSGLKAQMEKSSVSTP